MDWLSDMRSIVVGDLELEHLYVVYPGEASFPLDDGITALSILDVHATLRG